MGAWALAPKVKEGALIPKEEAPGPPPTMPELRSRAAGIKLERRGVSSMGVCIPKEGVLEVRSRDPAAGIKPERCGVSSMGAMVFIPNEDECGPMAPIPEPRSRDAGTSGTRWLNLGVP